MKNKNDTCGIPRWQQLKNYLNNVKVENLERLLEKYSNLQLIDVRTPTEFNAFHLPSAINMNYLSENFWEQIEQLDKSRTYLIYCRTGRRSVRTCTLMRNGGFDNEKILHFDGGLIAWKNFTEPLESKV